MRRLWMISLLLTVLALSLLCTSVLAAMPGAIWTTDVNGTVNRNIYYDKCDVYLNGGPVNRGDPGLPDGNYYFQVTDPDGGTLLSTGDISTRAFTVVNGWFTSLVQLCPYNDTPNSGGEYKVWITLQSDYNAYGGFDPDKSKTDNFKVRTGPTPPSWLSISGCKYYDADLSGTRTGSEVGIPGWRIEIYQDSIDPLNLVLTTMTDSTGNWTSGDLEPGTYIVKEVMPLGSWVQTGPKDFSGTPVSATGGIYTVVLTTSDITGIDFGNVVLGPGGGLTLGFWTNKNGQTVLSSNWGTISGSGILGCSILNGLPYTPLSDSEDIAVFLKNANAVDMQCMLAAQWLTMELNIRTGNVDPNAMIYTGSDFISAQDLVDYVCTNWSSWDRSTQEKYKDILDNANNNKNFVQPGPELPIVYP